ncbi:MAG: translational GTPase TypA [Candidatus Abawacabacteria bacterium]|nr:translational GTPase TypA [Candidatus Abawacabacteria bacterium]
MLSLRNIAVIAHVDHGKTTLVDALLRQTHSLKEKEGEEQKQIMDSNDLERERGITIFAKNASFEYKGSKINLVDTPGHADFGGEVERTLRMVDGALLLVDAKEGPMPQTRFVLKKSLELGHKVIVVINKIDKKDVRIDWVVNKTFDLFVELGATDEQADFPIVYAAGALGKAGPTQDLNSMENIVPLLDTIISVIPEGSRDEKSPLQALVFALKYDSYKGQLGICKLYRGQVKKGQDVLHMKRDGTTQKARLAEVLVYEGLGMKNADIAYAGDIVVLAGMEGLKIGDTIADKDQPEALPVIQVEEPTVKMMFSVNTSPFAGKEGDFVTTRQIRERLYRELMTDMALRVDDTGSADQWIVSGRGELHLSILLETMRREGYEVQVSKPEVIFKEENGQKLEPYEEITCEVPKEFSGTVIEKMGKRKAEMTDMQSEGDRVIMVFTIPTRGFIGFRSEFLTDTKGQGIMNTVLLGYRPYAGDIQAMPHGSLIAFETGETTPYALFAIQDRGDLFIGPNVQVYAGMVIGRNAKPLDMEVNACRAKKLTNMRASGNDENVILTPAKNMSLEQSLEYISEDELVEITPQSIRIRKMVLDQNARKRSQR